MILRITAGAAGVGAATAGGGVTVQVTLPALEHREHIRFDRERDTVQVEPAWQLVALEGDLPRPVVAQGSGSVPTLELAGLQEGDIALGASDGQEFGLRDVRINVVDDPHPGASVFRDEHGNPPVQPEGAVKCSVGGGGGVEFHINLEDPDITELAVGVLLLVQRASQGGTVREGGSPLQVETDQEWAAVPLAVPIGAEVGDRGDRLARGV
jgi:hypothetical protein